MYYYMKLRDESNQIKVVDSKLKFVDGKNEFVKFIKTGKDQLWQENKRLKKALKTASRWLSQLNQCPYSFQCPQGECTDEIAEACFMEYWMSEEGSHEKPID